MNGTFTVFSDAAVSAGEAEHLLSWLKYWHLAAVDSSARLKGAAMFVGSHLRKVDQTAVLCLNPVDK